MSKEQAEASYGQNHVQETSFGQQQLPQERIYQVTDGLRAKHTKRTYRNAFGQFLRDGAKTTDLQLLLDHKPRVLEQMIIGYIESLRDKGRTHRTIALHVAAILHFFVTLNDTPLNKRKITRFIPPDEESTHADKAYTADDILRVLNVCDIRTKVMVLLMASTGMRLGALPVLRVGHLIPISEYNLYQINVYATSRKERYPTYCTPECRNIVDAYVEYRRRIGENITDESPLIRELFSPANPFTVNKPKPSTDRMITQSLEKVLNKAGVNQRSIGLGRFKRRGIMRSHGFRKFCITQMKKAGLDFSDRHSLLGHKSNVANDLNYDRTPDSDRLEEYVKAIPLLTIEPTQRLEKENQDLKAVQAERITRLEARLDETERLLDTWRKVANDEFQLSQGKYCGKDGKWHHEPGFEIGPS